MTHHIVWLRAAVWHVWIVEATSLVASLWVSGFVDLEHFIGLVFDVVDKIFPALRSEFTDRYTT